MELPLLKAQFLGLAELTKLAASCKLCQSLLFCLDLRLKVGDLRVLLLIDFELLLALLNLRLKRRFSRAHLRDVMLLA